MSELSMSTPLIVATVSADAVVPMSSIEAHIEARVRGVPQVLEQREVAIEHSLVKLNWSAGKSYRSDGVKALI